MKHNQYQVPRHSIIIIKKKFSLKFELICVTSSLPSFHSLDRHAIAISIVAVQIVAKNGMIIMTMPWENGSLFF